MATNFPMLTNSTPSHVFNTFIYENSKILKVFRKEIDLQCKCNVQLDSDFAFVKLNKHFAKPRKSRCAAEFFLESQVIAFFTHDFLHDWKNLHFYRTRNCYKRIHKR